MSVLREKKKSERKDRIFSAAVDLFNEKGFSNTSMQDIAENSNLAVGTLYNYFPSKNDLLLEIMQDEMEITITESSALFNDVNLQDKSAKDIIKLLAKKIFSVPLLVNKESLKEIFIATFSSNVYMKKWYDTGPRTYENLSIFAGAASKSKHDQPGNEYIQRNKNFLF